MRNEIAKNWIEAGKLATGNPESKVLCPVCENSFLQITDVRNEKNFSEIERHMFCNECRAYNALRLFRPE